MIQRENFRLQLAKPMTAERYRQCIEENNQVYMLATYSLMFVNDIASDAVFSLEGSLKSDKKLYRQEVKRKYKILLDKQRNYSRQLNNVLDREAQQYIADWSCNFWDVVEKDFKMLKQTWKNEMLRADCPDPYICAELNYVREVIEIAEINYQVWIKELKQRIPMLVRVMALGNVMAEWHDAYVQLSNQICYSLNIANREIDVNYDQLELAKTICCRRVGNCELIAKAVGWKEIES